MPRSVTAELDLSVAGGVDLIFSLAVAAGNSMTTEELHLALDGESVQAREILGPSGTRLHRLALGPGTLTIRYRAEVSGRSEPPASSERELVEYVRPSRYCQSDELFDQARHLFRGRSGADLVRAVADFATASITYTPGGSLGTDSAVTTLMTGRGVCRDYAHVVIAMLRAMDVPARYTSCYAPGLVPMDFHAVAEAYIEGEWHVVDATRLAPRGSLVRIATGRDAADCAFLDFHGGYVGLDRLWVDAHADDVRPDDHRELLTLG